MHIIPGSGGYKLAIFHHKHLIDRRQNLGNRTVRNVNKPFHALEKSTLNPSRRSVVQPSGKLIHNIERAFVQEHTCKQDTLFLPAGKRPQIVAQHIIKTLRGNPLAQTCALTSPENLHIRHRRIVQANIFAQTIVQQMAVLRKQTQGSVHILFGNLTQIAHLRRFVHLNSSAVFGVISKKRFEKRRFARAGCANHQILFTSLKYETHAITRRLFAQRLDVTIGNCVQCERLARSVIFHSGYFRINLVNNLTTCIILGQQTCRHKQRHANHTGQLGKSNHLAHAR